VHLHDDAQDAGGGLVRHIELSEACRWFEALLLERRGQEPATVRGGSQDWLLASLLFLPEPEQALNLLITKAWLKAQASAGQHPWHTALSLDEPRDGLVPEGVMQRNGR